MSKLYGILKEEIIDFARKEKHKRAVVSGNGHIEPQLPGVKLDDHWSYEPYTQRSDAESGHGLPPWLQRAIANPASADQEVSGSVHGTAPRTDRSSNQHIRYAVLRSGTYHHQRSHQSVVRCISREGRVP